MACGRRGPGDGAHDGHRRRPLTAAPSRCGYPAAEGTGVPMPERGEVLEGIRPRDSGRARRRDPQLRRPASARSDRGAAGLEARGPESSPSPNALHVSPNRSTRADNRLWAGASGGSSPWNRAPFLDLAAACCTIFGDRAARPLAAPISAAAPSEPAHSTRQARPIVRPMRPDAQDIATAALDALGVATAGSRKGAGLNPAPSCTMMNSATVP